MAAYLKELENLVSQSPELAAARPIYVAAHTSVEHILRDMVGQRKKLGLTQADIAKKLGVTQARVSQMESGDSGIGLLPTLLYAAAVGADLKFVANNGHKGSAERKASPTIKFIGIRRFGRSQQSIT